MENKQIPRELISKIIADANIVDVISEFVNLNKKGNNYVGLCPFHEDSSPSFTVSPQKQIFKCFPCGAAGNVVTFLERFKNWNFIQAVEFLAQKQGNDFDFSAYKNNRQINTYSQEDLEIIDLLSVTNSFYKVQLLTSPQAQEYLKSRNLDDAALRDKFDIGFAPKSKTLEYLKSLNYSSGSMLKAGLINSDLHELFWDRVTFGIRNQYGDLVGFSARSIQKDPQAKYVNSPATKLFNKSQILYNYHNAKESIQSKKEVIIVEGFMDAIALYKAGIPNVVALMGTALTKEHLNLIKNNKVILFLDNDNAGIDAALRTTAILLQNNFTVSLIDNHYSKDADEILNTYGSDVLVDLIKTQRVSAINFVYDKLKIKYKVAEIKDYEVFSQFIQVLSNYLTLFDIDQQKYIASLLEKEFNYVLDIALSPHHSAGSNTQNNITQVDFRTTPNYAKKIELLTNQTRFNLLVKAMGNPNILQILKNNKDVAIIFSKPENIKNLFEQTLNLDDSLSENQVFEIIHSQASELLERIDFNKEINNYIIKEFIQNKFKEIQCIDGCSIPLQPLIAEQVDEWNKFKNFLYPEEKGLKAPGYIQDQIALLQKYNKEIKQLQIPSDKSKADGED
ncbi:DNA primase [Mycoplasma seminis]|uniref:DNA primase n=1 Tax=Mycoplasma seminis TaxID=512749 RepID=A0ABY9HBC4_9MOLU|nr:DNA primase [Mycoplasma seminis]WLP85885.1 DNA primase [Mycoplasma seminis]